MVNHLEPDILESEVKWALGSITMNKASGADRILATFSNPKRCSCENASLNMPANLENSAVATGLEKVSFHSSPKEGQCQRVFKLLNNCTHLTRYQSNAQNFPSEASTVHELKFQMFKLDLQKVEEPETKLPTSAGLSKK